MNFTDLSTVETVRLYQGDCRKVMAALPDNSVDSVVCDPPYEIGLMSKKWDKSGIAFDPEVWSQALRVLKPGGHLLAFGATRMYHRLGTAIEDAGFEIRDCIAYAFGSGFPKSLDVGAAVAKPKPGGTTRSPEDIDTALSDDEQKFCDWMRDHSGISDADARKLRVTRFLTGEVDTTNAASRDKPPRWARSAMVPTAELWSKIKSVLPADPPSWVEDLVKTASDGDGRAFLETVHSKAKIDGEKAPPGVTTDAPWSGWGTGLKPAYEPVILARKALSESNIAGNVIAHGTGAINIGACRVGDDVRTLQKVSPKAESVALGAFHGTIPERDVVGRWPANVIVDEATADHLGDSAKFFYCAKAPQRERPSYTNASGKTIKHSTVKPLSLMRYLVRLVTPPGGTVLDPFAGSGATLEAAVLEGFNSIGIELGEDHIPLILQRLDRSAAA